MNRPGKEGIFARIVWAAMILVIGLMVARCASGGTGLLEPGWFDTTRDNLEQTVDNGRDRAREQIEQRAPAGPQQ